MIYIVVSLQPCEIRTVNVAMNVYPNANFESYQYNSKFVVYYYDLDEMEDLGENAKVWECVPKEYLAR